MPLESMRTEESKISICNYGSFYILYSQLNHCVFLFRLLYVSKEDINAIPRFQVRTLLVSCLFLLPAIVKLYQQVRC